MFAVAADAVLAFRTDYKRPDRVFDVAYINLLFIRGERGVYGRRNFSGDNGVSIVLTKKTLQILPLYIFTIYNIITYNIYKSNQKRQFFVT